jgi:hypothetical protein
MAKRKTHNIITGNDPELRMYFYYSPHYGLNIWRRGSSLTGERTKTDPAFKGFRQSSSRLKQASPIAASLYKMVPGHVKQYSLYRTLTGEAIKLLKEGMEEALITETLEKKYITPLLETTEKISKIRTIEKPVTRDRIKGMRDFTSYPQTLSGIKKMTRTRRSYLLKQIIELQSAAEYFPSIDSDPPVQPGRNISESPLDESEPTKQRRKTTTGLIYLGRLPECKKLKIWLRPIGSSA